MNNTNAFLWSERYRPKTIDECILPDAQKQTFKDFVAKGEVPNMLLCGTAGVGKTTVARALCEELGCDYIIINSSLESGIDTLRTKIQQFCSSVSFSGGTKVVILDEFDYANCMGGEQQILVYEDGELVHKPLDSLVGGQLVIPSIDSQGNHVFDEGYVIETGEKELFEVGFEDGTVMYCTSDHKFFNSEMEEVSIDEFEYLACTDMDDKSICTKKIVSVKSIGTRKVYDVITKDTHKFILSNGVVAHNCNTFQPAFRAFLEEFSNNARFILTCNFKNRIIEPIHSRCTVFEFAIEKTDRPKIAAKFMQRIKTILDTESITYDEKVVAALLMKHFPDYRRVINELQRYSSNGTIDAGILSSVQEVNIKNLMKTLKDKDFKAMRKWVAENSNNESGIIFRKIYDTCSDYVLPQSIPNLILLLADYQYKSAFSADQEINLVACLTEIMATLDFA
jgi:DNA polymerase III delta prime subunit